MNNIVFLHGFCETKEMWQEFAPSLANDFNVFCLDLPGFGENLIDVTNYSIVQIAENIYFQIESLNLDSYFIIGHSLGGYVALEFAQLFPQKLNGICLFHSTPFADSIEKQENRNKSIQFINKYGIQMFIQSFVPSLFYNKNKIRLKDEVEFMTNLCSKTSQKSAIEITKAMRDRKSAEEFLKNTKLPILFIVGKEDTFFNFSELLNFIEEINTTSVVILDKVGHLGMFEDKEKCKNAIKKYIFEHN